MRITEHPILDFNRESAAAITFTFDGTKIIAYEGETIAAALHAAGIRTLSHSTEKQRPRGLYCAIGNCSSCFMIVDGQPNVKTCIVPVKNGMVVETQKDKGALK